MADQVANLEIVVDIQSGVRAIDVLNRLAVAAANCETQTGRLASAQAQAAQRSAATVTQINAQRQALDQLVNTQQNLASVINQRFRVQDDFASANRAKDIAEYGKQMDNLRAKYNPLFSAGRQYKDTLTEINMAARVGAISEKEREVAITRTKDAFATHVKSMKESTSASNGAAMSTKAISEQMKILGFQAIDVGTMFSLGASPFMIIASQGGQVFQALNGPGGVSQGLVNLKDKLVGMVTPARAMGVAFAAAATVAFIAWNNFDNQQKKLLATVQGLGREAGLTVEELRKIGERGASLGNLPVSTGVDAASGLARANPQVSPQNMVRLIALTKDWAATYTDGDIQSAQQQIDSLVKGGASAVLDFAKNTHKLNDEQLENVKRAAEGKDINTALSITLDAINGKMASYSQTTGKVAQSWEEIKNSSKDLMAALGPFLDKMAGAAAGFVRNAADVAQFAGGTGKKELDPVKIGGLVSTLNTMGADGSFGAQPPDFSKLVPGAAAATTATKSLADAMRSTSKAQAEAAFSADVLGSSVLNQARNVKTAGDDQVKVFATQTEQLERQKGALQQNVAQMDARHPAYEAYKKQLEVTTSALKSNSNAEREAALNQEVLKAHQLENTNAARRTSEANQRLSDQTQDLTEKGISQIGTLRELNAQQKLLAEKKFETGFLNKNEEEQLSRVTHAINSQTDSNGKRINSMTLFERQADIQKRQITDMTVASRAQTAVDAEVLRLVGQGIPVEEARARAREAGLNVIRESNQQMVLASREQVFNQQRLELEASLLFSTARARARANAELQKEQELKRAGRDPRDEVGRAQIKVAGDQAELGQAQSEQEQQWERIKQAGVGAFTSIATAIASGTKAMDAMHAAAKQLGSALISGGIAEIAKGNTVLGSAEAIVGVGLTLFEGDRDKRKAKQKKQLEQAKTDADEAARKAEQINQAISTYLQRITAAAFAGQADNLQNRLAQFDTKAQSERLEALSKGGAAINLLEVALGLERANIVSDWNKKLADDEKAAAEARAQALDAINQRVKGAGDRLFAAGIDTSTFAGKVAALERQFQQEQQDEMKAGGEAINDLIAAQNAERVRLYEQSAKELQQKLEAIAQRQRSAQDRIFASQIDTNTIAGKIAALERQFQREREEEMKTGGEAINDLIAAQNAERLRLEQDLAMEELRVRKQSFDDAKDFITASSRTIKQFLDNLETGAQSPLAPQARLAAAQTQFSSQFGIIHGQDPVAAREALSGITGYANTLLESARAFHGSTSGYQSVFNQVKGQLSTLPSQVSPEQFIVNAIDTQTDTLSNYLKLIDLNGDGLISRTEANGTFLQSIFNELDVNGDGMLQKSELIRINTGGTKDSVDVMQGLQASNNSLTNGLYNLMVSINGLIATEQGILSSTYSSLNVSQGILSSMNSLLSTEQSILSSSASIQGTMSGSLSTQISQLSSANNSLATQINSLANLAKIVFNTAQLVNFQNTQGHGSGAFARGGYVDGYGSETSDSNIARLSRGEFVTQASVVRRVGRSFFDQLNSGAPIQLGSRGNDGMLLAELRQLRAEVAQLRAVTAAGAEHVREGVDNVAAGQSDMTRQTKLSDARKR